MAELNKKKTENDLDENEINRLRDAVLNWVDKKRQVEDSKPKPKNSIAAKIFEKPTPKPNTAPVKPKPAESIKSLPATPAPKKIPTGPKSPKSLVKKLKILLISLIIITVTAGIVFGIGLYYFKWQNKATKAITRVIPYPIAFVNWQPLFYYTWQDQVSTLSNFYQNELQKDPTLLIPTFPEIQTHILNRMIDLALINQLAADYQVTISQDEVKKYIDSLVEEIGSQAALEKQLKDIYNWDINDFKHEIIEPLLLKNKLALAVILDDRINKDARTRIQAILDEYNSGEKTFEELALEYSEDITAFQNGDLGYFSRGQMIKEFEDTAFNLKPGEVSGIVKTQFGYHLIKVEEQLLDEEGELTQVRAKHILIRGVDFDKFLEDHKNQATVWQLIKI